MNSRALAALLLLLVVAAVPHARAQDDFVLGNKSEAVAPEPPTAPVPLPAEVELRRAEPGSDPLEIGDEVELHISLLPHPDAGRGTVRSISVQPPRGQAIPFLVDGAPRRLTSGKWAVGVTVLVAPGDGMLPGARITATFEDGTVAMYQAPPFEAAVSTPSTGGEEPRDYTPAIEAPFNWTRAIVLGTAAALLAAAAAAALAVLLVRWWRRRIAREVPTAPPVPPLDEARASLARLQSMEVFRNAGARGHYFELSFILRRYFERAFGFPALEMTEDELVDRIRTRMAANAGAQLLPEVFDAASLAKFAKWAADEDRAARHTRLAMAFLDNEADRAVRAGSSGGTTTAPQEAA